MEQVITHGKIKQPKIDKDSGAEIIRQLANLGGNVNQMAKWCNLNKHEVDSEQAENVAPNHQVAVYTHTDKVCC